MNMKFVAMGLGSIGSNLLLNIAKIYPKAKFVGVDFDKVETRNLPVQPYFLNHVGMPKANALQVILGLKIRGIAYNPVNRKIESDDDPVISNNDDAPHTLILDCFDNAESRKLLEGINNCLHIGFSPKYAAEIIWGKDYTTPPNIDPAENDVCEMSEAVPFINYVVSMATFTVQEFIETKKKSSYLVLNKFNLRRLS